MNENENGIGLAFVTQLRPVQGDVEALAPALAHPAPPQPERVAQHGGLGPVLHLEAPLAPFF